MRTRCYVQRAAKVRISRSGCALVDDSVTERCTQVMGEYSVEHAADSLGMPIQWPRYGQGPAAQALWHGRSCQVFDGRHDVRCWLTSAQARMCNSPPNPQLEFPHSGRDTIGFRGNWRKCPPAVSDSSVHGRPHRSRRKPSSRPGRRNSHIACRRDAPRKILAFSLILLTPS